MTPGKHPAPEQIGGAERVFEGTRARNACQYALIITYGRAFGTRIFADRGEEAGIRICTNTDGIYARASGGATMIVSDARRG